MEYDGISENGPSVVLIKPQLAENVGTVARAMLNFGLRDLRLVRPKADWLSDKAISTSAGASDVLELAQVFESTEEAIADLNSVLATTARRRDMTKVVMSPTAAASEMNAVLGKGNRLGVLFGPESSGLNNDDIALADAVVVIPTNPRFKSLNLAMAVLLLGYEWFLQATRRDSKKFLRIGQGRAATKQELHGFFAHLEESLDGCGFLRVEEKRPHMVRSIRNIFQRADLTEQEVRTLRGVVSGLVTHASVRGKICKDG